MGKLLLMSVVLATIAIPVVCARDRVARRGLKRMLLFLCLFNALYIVILLHVYVPMNAERLYAAFKEAGFMPRIAP